MLGTGIRIGPYEILSALGAGGMGEVYRARDTRLDRLVAIKVLPAAYSTNEERLRRFEQEARAAGILDHPNLLAIHDFGLAHDGSPYIVSELLEGETLRNRLAGGALGVRKAIDYGLQIVQGLAAAHDKGIVHRDLKPENLFVTREGRVKILDFGLAKLVPKEVPAALSASSPTMLVHTEPGTIVGTSDYMSPEQVRGQPLDQRSDLFSFGAILYEMLTGQRAFEGDSAVEIMNAILRDEPPEIQATNRTLPPALERIVLHALEKNPEERFQSARDLAFHLQAISDPSAPTPAPVGLPARSRRLLAAGLAAGALLVAALGGVYVAGERAGRFAPPEFHPLTFRRGTVSAARFAPDGQTILYSAAWDGSPAELFSTRPESPESRPLGLPSADLLAISPGGDMAISLGSHVQRACSSRGTLARVPLVGGAPREVVEDALAADWAPDGTLAVVRGRHGSNDLEYPLGKVLYSTTGWIGHPRLSPDGALLAFVDHPMLGDDGGAIAVVDRAGHVRKLSSGWISAQGLAWSARGDEIWFTATKVGIGRAVYALSLGGKERLVARAAGTLTLHDVCRDGRVLLTHDTARTSISCVAPGTTTERDLSWLDWSRARHFSADGKTLLFDETGQGAGACYGVYVRGTDGAAAVRLGDGAALSLSPDGRWALAFTAKAPGGLVLLPTRAGERQAVATDVPGLRWAAWFPDGRRLLCAGIPSGQKVQLYEQDLSGGPSRAVAEPGAGPPAVLSPDGKLVAAWAADAKLAVFPLAGGAPRRYAHVQPGDVPVQWSADGKSLFLFRCGVRPAQVLRLDLATGRLDSWKAVAPIDPAGIVAISPPCMTPDGLSFAYSYSRIQSDLYLVTGLE